MFSGVDSCGSCGQLERGAESRDWRERQEQLGLAACGRLRGGLGRGRLVLGGRVGPGHPADAAARPATGDSWAGAAAWSAAAAAAWTQEQLWQQLPGVQVSLRD